MTGEFNTLLLTMDHSGRKSIKKYWEGKNGNSSLGLNSTQKGLWVISYA